MSDESTVPPDDSEEDAAEVLTSAEKIRTKIIFILSLYPGINTAMLQMGLTPAVRSHVWRPILDEMIRNGEVIVENRLAWSPARQHRSYMKLIVKEPIDPMAHRPEAA